MQKSFSDMPNSWSTTALENGVKNGLIDGSNGKILPNEDLTRAQMSAIINRAFGSIVQADLANFTDVKDGAWYVADLKKSVKMGI